MGADLQNPEFIFPDEDFIDGHYNPGISVARIRSMNKSVFKKGEGAEMHAYQAIHFSIGEKQRLWWLFQTGHERDREYKRIKSQLRNELNTEGNNYEQNYGNRYGR